MSNTLAAENFILRNRIDFLENALKQATCTHHFCAPHYIYENGNQVYKSKCRKCKIDKLLKSTALVGSVVWFTSTEFCT